MSAFAARNRNINLASVLPAEGYRESTVLVVGDLMLDRYISGEVTRISPEAPVPVLAVGKERSVAGGAANVALNVAGLGARTMLAGVVGADSAGEKLRGILEQSGIDSRAILTDSTRATTCKTRVMAGNHQIVRLDEEVVEEIDSTLAGRLMVQFRWLLSEGVTAVVLSDYGKGVLSTELTTSLIAECAARGLPVFVDPKRVDYRPYAGATCLTPNQKELNMALSALGLSTRELAASAQQLRERLRCATLLVTQGAQGMTLVTAEQTHHFPALAQEVFDVSGAGDTVIGVVAAATGSGVDMLHAVQLANLAASIVVRRAGTAPIALESLYELVQSCAQPASGVLQPELRLALGTQI
jgi:D-beta-D-heptose 7-phosphate kinase / D-beta-D-heptose 1-phosphate adenosyltransferase